jgi:hypothetical protein
MQGRAFAVGLGDLAAQQADQVLSEAGRGGVPRGNVRVLAHDEL